MRSKYCLLGIALVTMLVLFDRAQGCTCGGGGTPCLAFGEASAVFVGTVTGVVKSAPQTREQARAEKRAEIDWIPPRRFKFSVELSFLGVEGTEVEVGTGMGGGDCGYEFEIGQRYLVYAHRSAQSERLSTSICSRTKPYANAAEDLQFLGNLRALAQGVTIYGEVKRQTRSVKTDDPKAVGPVAQASLIIEGASERKEVRTDEQGRYRLSGLPPGKYEVTLSLPDEMTTYQPKREVTVADRGCATVDYYVSDNGRLSGRVFDAAGQPAGNVLMALIEEDGQDIERDYSKSARSDPEGRYSFTAVPPGRYLLAVNLTRFPQPNDPTNEYPRTYYPGVAEPSQATVIKLGAGEKLSELDLRLPLRRVARAIHVTVLWADGKPVANAGISFREVTYHDSRNNYGANADEQGRFTINGYEGQTFVIEARSDRPYISDGGPFKPMERTAPVRITVGSQTAQVKIIITRLR